GGNLAGVNVATLGLDGATLGTVVDGGSAHEFAWNASAADVLAALRVALDPNDSDPSLPYTRNVNVTKIGDVFTIYFEGALAGTAAPALAVLDHSNGSVTAATRTNGIDYYGVETLNLEYGSGADTVNVQGTSARTNLDLHGGTDRVYVSSEANVTPTTSVDFLQGNLDAIQGMLNVRAGDGDQQVLMISDAPPTAGKNVLMTDTASEALACDPAVPGTTDKHLAET